LPWLADKKSISNFVTRSWSKRRIIRALSIGSRDCD